MKILCVLLPTLLIFICGCTTLDAPEFGSNETVVSLNPASDKAAAQPDDDATRALADAVTPEVSNTPLLSPEKVKTPKPTKRDIQTALKNAGYYALTIDGKFGPQTKKAAEEFQAANNLEIDGVVGPATWNLLKKYLNLDAQS